MQPLQTSSCSKSGRKSRRPSRFVMGMLRKGVRFYRAVDGAFAWFQSRPRGCKGDDKAGATFSLGANVTAEPNVNHGPILCVTDAPKLYSILHKTARIIETDVPSEVRISYLPACGVIELDQNNKRPRRVLLLGMPCLQAWTVGELQAVLGHELTHCRDDDAKFARDVVQFAMSVREQVDQGGLYGMRRWMARRMSGTVLKWSNPIARRTEFEADESSAQHFGGPNLVRALEKLAVAQAIFDQIMAQFDPMETVHETVYDQFGRAWAGLPAASHQRLKERLVHQNQQDDPTHPTLAERFEKLNKFPEVDIANGQQPALSLLKAPADVVSVLHNRLYCEHPRRSSVFMAMRDDDDE